MADLKVTVAGVEFQNPLIVASGTFGFGHEYLEFFLLSTLGGVSCKGITLKERMGNPPPRIAEAPGGMPNMAGLQNPGVDTLMEKDLPWLSQQGTRVIANITGNAPAEHCEVAECLSDTAVDMTELSISCPNVKRGGVHFGTSCAGMEDIAAQVHGFCKEPLMVKLPPNVAGIGDIADAAESTGADTISLVDTLTGMHIDIKTCRPILHNNTGGLSGPAVLPVAVRMVWQAAVRVSIPVVGMGSISTWQDAVEMLLAGASVLQIGTVSFSDPKTPPHILKGLNEYMEQDGIPSVTELTGGIMP